jgi:hypothetical protein
MALRLTVALIALLVSACGGGPAQPGLPTYVLAAGEHTVTISVWVTTTSNPYGFTRSELVCTGTGSTSITFVADVTREGDVWIVRSRSGDLTLRVSATSGTYEGSMGGTTTSNGVSVIVNDAADPSRPAMLPASVSSYNLIGSRIDGSVRFVSAQGEQSCSNNIWTIAPR